MVTLDDFITANTTTSTPPPQPPKLWRSESSPLSTNSENPIVAANIAYQTILQIPTKTRDYAVQITDRHQNGNMVIVQGIGNLHDYDWYLRTVDEAIQNATQRVAPYGSIDNTDRQWDATTKTFQQSWIFHSFNR